MSFCCWVKLNEINKIQTLFSSCRSFGAGLSFLILNNNKLRFDNMADTIDETYQTIFDYTFSTGIWYHIAVIQTLTQQKLYINGILQQSINKVSMNKGNNTANKCLIGANNNNNNIENQLNGYLNDIRIYNHALSDKEIEEISKGLILHYKLDAIFDNKKIYDFSGYNNNGTIIGSLSTISDTARYNYAINFIDGSNNYVVINSTNFPIDNITMSIWCKTSNNSPTGGYHWLFGRNLDYQISIKNDGALSVGYYINNIRYFKTIDNINLINNLWHMITSTYDGHTIKIYIDGQFKDSINAVGLLSPVSDLYLGVQNDFNYAVKECHLSDARIYATALTEKQIKELYNTSVTIDNLGNIYSREFDENLNLNITQTGIFGVNEIIDGEYTMASILKDTNIVQGNNLYEY